MIDLALNDSDDLYLDESGDLATVESKAAIAQALQVGYRTFKGFLFWNVDAGLPYREIIFEKGTSRKLIRALFIADTLSTPGVEEVTNLEVTIDKSTRRATVTGEVVTTEGLLELEA